MAPAPRKSEAEIDKLADPRAPPHIILRTLPSLSFATPTHSVRVQLSFQPPTPHKLLAMSGQTAVDVQHIPDSRNSFGGPPQPYNDNRPLTRLDVLEGTMATKDAVQALSKKLNDTINQRGVATNATIVAISNAFNKFKDNTFVKFENDRKTFEEDTLKALEGQSLEIANVVIQIGDLEKRMDNDFKQVNEKLDNIMAMLSASASVPVATTASGSPKRGSPVTFLREDDTSSLPDSLLYPPLEPPSPSGLSPSSLKPPSVRKRISTASMKKVNSVTKTVQGAFSRLKIAKHNIEDTMQDLDAMTQMLGAGQQQDDALLQSPQQYESPVAGPSTPTETQTASKGKSKLKLDQPIQRDRQ